jgi:SAM-dependent methyltransferase
MSSNNTKKVYDTFGKKYHEKLMDVKQSFWNKYLDEYWTFKLLKKAVRGKRVLDLGCGSGIRTRKLVGMGAKTTGIDFSKTLIEIARKDNPNIPFYIGDIRKTPFRSAEFDVVNSNLVLHYFKDLKPIFKETQRILKKGGIFIFSLHHPFCDSRKKVVINGRKEYIFTEYFHNKASQWSILEGMNVMTYHHTFENIINSLKESGFIIDKIVETTAPGFSRKKDAQEYEKTTKYPSFLVIKAIKA